jgi:hypothetical protein
MNLKSYIHNFQILMEELYAIFIIVIMMYFICYIKRMYIFNYNLINLARNTDNPTIRAIINELINGT